MALLWPIDGVMVSGCRGRHTSLGLFVTGSQYRKRRVASTLHRKETSQDGRGCCGRRDSPVLHTMRGYPHGTATLYYIISTSVISTSVIIPSTSVVIPSTSVIIPSTSIVTPRRGLERR